MTRNLLVDNFRRTRNLRATGSLDDGWESTEELKPIDRLTSKGPSPHESAAQKELAKMVQQRPGARLRRAARSGHPAGPAGSGLQRDCPGAGHSRRDREVPHQPGPRGTGTPAGT